MAKFSTPKTLRRLSELEAKLDQTLFQKQPFLTGGKNRAENESRGEYATRTAKGATAGAVVIGTGGAVRHVLREHYGAAQGGYKEAGRNAARDVKRRVGEEINGARVSAGEAASKARNSGVGRAVEKGARHAENAAVGAGRGIRSGVRKVAGGVEKVAKKLKKFDSPIARRLVALDARLERAGL